MADEEAGEFIVQFADRQKENAKEVIKMHTSTISMASKAVAGVNVQALPVAQGSAYKCKGTVVVRFKADAADTIESEESAWFFTLNLYNAATGVFEGTKVLTSELMTGFTTAGTADVVCVAGESVYVAHWDVPDGKYATITPGAKVHAYIGDDT